MQLHWIKCEGNTWCSLTKVNLSTVTEYGVYIIWHDGEYPNVVYVGQGDVADRIDTHRGDHKITRHDQKGTLFVTWASVSYSQRDGVERYLADKFSPLEGEHHPVATPIEVNSPWD